MDLFSKPACQYHVACIATDATSESESGKKAKCRKIDQKTIGCKLTCHGKCATKNCTKTSYKMKEVPSFLFDGECNW